MTPFPSSSDFEPGSRRPGWLRRAERRFIDFCRRRPLLSLLLVVIGWNGLGSITNILYNRLLVVEIYMDERQKAVFEQVAMPVYNVLAYPVCLALVVWFFWPVLRVHRRLLAGAYVPPQQLLAARRLLVMFPFYQLFLNVLGWMPGAILFPLLICWLGGSSNADRIWLHFGISFTISCLLAMMQVFFLMEAVLVRVYYPIYFRDTRLTDVPGVRLVPYWSRLAMFYAAVGLMPVLAVLAVALNYAETARRIDAPAAQLQLLALAVAVISVILAFIIALLVGGGLLRWLNRHREAMNRITHGDLKARVAEKRPDEWGRLTEHFNEMADAIEQAEQLRETFGQMQHPAVRDAIIKRYPGIGGEVCEITVLFADIRGFTRRSAGKPPERAFALLNRFLTLAFQSVEEKGGFVDKILGDGVMALFGLPFLPDPAGHADLAVAAALDMVRRLGRLNDELQQFGEEPLRIGIGIHSGPALVGCPGATLHAPQGGLAIRRGFTAIGETVNLAQRMEQLTKSLGGPVLLSEATRCRLRRTYPLAPLGEQEIPGHGGTLHVYRVEAEHASAAVAAGQG